MSAIRAPALLFAIATPNAGRAVRDPLGRSRRLRGLKVVDAVDAVGPSQLWDHRSLPLRSSSDRSRSTACDCFWDTSCGVFGDGCPALATPHDIPGLS